MLQLQMHSFHYTCSYKLYKSFRTNVIVNILWFQLFLWETYAKYKYRGSLNLRLCHFIVHNFHFPFRFGRSDGGVSSELWQRPTRSAICLRSGKEIFGRSRSLSWCHWSENFYLCSFQLLIKSNCRRHSLIMWMKNTMRVLKYCIIALYRYWMA